MSSKSTSTSGTSEPASTSESKASTESKSESSTEAKSTAITADMDTDAVLDATHARTVEINRDVDVDWNLWTMRMPT